jgi:hypothetical protein
MRAERKRWLKEIANTAGKIVLEIAVVIIFKRIRGGRSWK